MSDGYQTDVGAIRSDAKIWSQAATDLDAPRTAVQSLTLSTADIGYVTAFLTPLDETYNQLQKRIDDLLGGAQKSFNNISTTLTSVATDYATRDSAGSHDMARTGAGMEGS